MVSKWSGGLYSPERIERNDIWSAVKKVTLEGVGVRYLTTALEGRR